MFIRTLSHCRPSRWIAFIAAVTGTAVLGLPARAADRPCILLCIADDWGWPDAGAYGDPVVRTPAFDRVAREGVLFDHAFVTSPTCTASRNSLLTGQWPWRLGEGANLWSSLAPEHPVYPLLLEEAGYCVGHAGKGWGPGDILALGRTRGPAGKPCRDFAAFLAARPADVPFCFWLGSSDPHRPYARDSGPQAGIDAARVRVPADLPDHDVVRRDLADYLFEVQRFDALVGDALALLDRYGLANDTIVVITGDHGMPFPRHKGNLYDSGVRVPLAIRWPARAKAGRRVTDFVSLADLAPTFLEAAGVAVPSVMTGRSLGGILAAEASGAIEPGRDHALVGRERHTLAQEPPNTTGYPSRAIRTADHLYVRNFAPDRWPSGAPDRSTLGPAYADCDDGPTKQHMLAHCDTAEVARLADLAFRKRPAEELYDLRVDPEQLENIAADPAQAVVKAGLARRLEAELRDSGDPRMTGGGAAFDTAPYHGVKKVRVVQ